jgi:hypothetical protein
MKPRDNLSLLRKGTRTTQDLPGFGDDGHVLAINAIIQSTLKLWTEDNQV